MQHQITSLQHQSSDPGLQSFHQMWQESCGWHVRSLSKREYKLYKMLQGYHVDNVSLTAEVDKLNGDFSDMLKGYNDLYEEKGQLESQCYKFRHQICELSERAETSDVGVQVKPQFSISGSQTSSHKTDSSTQSSQSPEVTSHSTQASTITISKSSQTSDTQRVPRKLPPSHQIVQVSQSPPSAYHQTTNCSKIQPLFIKISQVSHHHLIHQPRPISHITLEKRKHTHHIHRPDQLEETMVLVIIVTLAEQVEITTGEKLILVTMKAADHNGRFLASFLQICCNYAV